MSARRPEAVRKLPRELCCWRSGRFDEWVAVDTSGGVYVWLWRVYRQSGEWLEDFESFGAEALRRVSRLLAKERKP